MTDIEIEIDGKKLAAKPNQMLIEVADNAGIYIPRFCYHKQLSIAANCRMCLVEVEKSPKALPACATPVMPGMKVFTKSAATIAAQRAVMEFLLINHPLDCPICDQGGECELQDLAMGYGSPKSAYDECKRAVGDLDLGPLVATEMTRCIHCTRCVRFGNEIAGMPEMGVTFRGEHEAISTYIKHALRSEVSGNMIDVCPVGALTSKPYRFTARSWEMQQRPTISAHDCVGSHINAHILNGKVMRVVARENPKINDCWIADRERFSYEALTHADRLEKPFARINNAWQEISWEKAFELITSRFQKIADESGIDQLAALISPNSTVEEGYLLQKIVRGMGSNNIDHRLREKDTRDQSQFGAYAGTTLSFEELVTCDAFLLIGSNLQKEQPLAALKLRQAIKNGATVVVVNPVDHAFNFKVDAKEIVSPQEMLSSLETLLSTLTQQKEHLLLDKKKVAVILGAHAMHHEEAAFLRHIAQEIASKINGHLICMTDGANAAGLWLAGAVPHRLPAGITLQAKGLSAYEMLDQPKKIMCLFNVEPARDSANNQKMLAALAQAEFVVAFSTFNNEALKEHADVILPIAPFTETAGTFVNVSGTWQSFQGVAQPFADSRPGWKVLRVLGNFLQLKGFEYESAEEVCEELKAQLTTMPDMKQAFKPINKLSKEATLTRIGEYPIYSVDGLVRRAEALQEAQTIMLGDLKTVKLHSDTAARLNLLAGDCATVSQENGHAKLRVVIDDTIAKNAAYVAAGITKTRTLGDLYGAISIIKSEKASC